MIYLEIWLSAVTGVCEKLEIIPGIRAAFAQRFFMVNFHGLAIGAGRSFASPHLIKLFGSILLRILFRFLTPKCFFHRIEFPSYLSKRFARYSSWRRLSPLRARSLLLPSKVYRLRLAEKINGRLVNGRQGAASGLEALRFRAQYGRVENDHGIVVRQRSGSDPSLKFPCPDTRHRLIARNA